MPRKIQGTVTKVDGIVEYGKMTKEDYRKIETIGARGKQIQPTTIGPREVQIIIDEAIHPKGCELCGDLRHLSFYKIKDKRWWMCVRCYRRVKHPNPPAGYILNPKLFKKIQEILRAEEELKTTRVGLKKKQGKSQKRSK